MMKYALIAAWERFRLDPWGAVLRYLGALLGDLIVMMVCGALLPLMVIMAGLSLDLISIQQWLLTATPAQVERAQSLFSMLVMVGMFIGLIGVRGYAVWYRVTSGSAGRAGVASLVRQPSDKVSVNVAGTEGSEWLLRENSTLREFPAAEHFWMMKDLLKELCEPVHAAGSDLLDRKLFKALGYVPSPPLKPTQSLKDAKALVSRRLFGTPSGYDWQVVVQALPTVDLGLGSPAESAGEVWTRATLQLRVPPADAATPGRWVDCVVARAPSPAMAVTLTVLFRETQRTMLH